MFGRSTITPATAPDFDVQERRSCTDLLCLFLFMIFCGVGVGIGVFGIQQGQSESLVYGRDDNNNICGYNNVNTECQRDTCVFADGTQKQTTSGEMKWAHTVKKDEQVAIDYGTASKKLQYVAYPRLAADLFDAAQQVRTDVQFFGICIDECPNKAGWQCSMYGKGYLADELGMTTWPTSLADEDCQSSDGRTCKEELDNCKNHGILNPTMPVSMHKYTSEKCSSLLTSCFYSSLPHTGLMYRCFPMYNRTTSYACDDDNDGFPDYNFPSYNEGNPDGPPMNGTWQQEPLSDYQTTMCGTMITKSLSQESASPNIIYEQIATTVAVLGRMLSDLTHGAIPIVISGMGVSIVGGFLWLILLRYCARVFVWLTIVLVVSMETLLTIYFYVQAGLLPDTPGLSSPDNQHLEVWKWVAIVMTVVLVIQCLGIIAAIKKINIATKIISEASKAVAAMPTLLVFPIFPVILIAGIFTWFVYIAVCLYSIPATVFETVDASGEDWGKYLLVLHLFVTLWSNAFVGGFMTMTVCRWCWHLVLY